MTNLKRLVRYLKKRPRAVYRFKPQRMDKELLVTVDSDHAGCAVTRKSTTGLVVQLGDHTVKTSSWIQSTVALSSGESEFYALVKGAAYGLSIQALLKDWNVNVTLRVVSDSSAARSFASRRGLGKQRHVQTRYLWIQERVGEGHVKIMAGPVKINDSDILTKAVSGAGLRRVLLRLGFEIRDKSLIQKETKKM